MSYNIGSLLPNIERSLNDEGEVVIGAPLYGIANGYNKKFKTLDSPIADVTIYVDGVEETAYDVVDNRNGIIQFDVAPTAGSIITADYTLFRYSRTRLLSYLDRAATYINERLGFDWDNNTYTGNSFYLSVDAITDYQEDLIIIAALLLILEDDLVAEAGLDIRFAAVGSTIDRTSVTNSRTKAIEQLRHLLEEMTNNYQKSKIDYIRVEPAQYFVW